jgi:hypothetical protein
MSVSLTFYAIGDVCATFFTNKLFNFFFSHEENSSSSHLKYNLGVALEPYVVGQHIHRFNFLGDLHIE